MFHVWFISWKSHYVRLCEFGLRKWRGILDGLLASQWLCSVEFFCHIWFHWSSVRRQGNFAEAIQPQDILWCRVPRLSGTSGMTSWDHPQFFFVFGWKGLRVGHDASGGHLSRRGGGELKWICLSMKVRFLCKNYFIYLPRGIFLLLAIPK